MVIYLYESESRRNERMTACKTWAFKRDESCFSGIVKIAEKIKKDVSLVTGFYPKDFDGSYEPDFLVVYGTVGNSEILDDYEKNRMITLDDVKGKREVYAFIVLEQKDKKTVVIAGSDKSE